MANNFCLDFLMIDFSGSLLIIGYLAWQDHSALGTTLFFYVDLNNIYIQIIK